MIELLHENWQYNLRNLISEAKRDIFISSPFVTANGVEFIRSQFSKEFRKKGKLTFLTNLSSTNIIKGSNSPEPFKLFSESINNFNLWHLPRLHAKVYISDERKSIVTSGNLTSGGLFNNFEYGVQIHDTNESKAIHEDINQYCQLGSKIDELTLSKLSEVATHIVRAKQKQDISIKHELNELLQSVEKELIEDRLNVGAIHNVFSKTVLYILQKFDRLTTEEIHLYVQQIHPDLCNDEVDRVIEGKSFGKKWKHAVRTSQQHLKRKGFIYLENGYWILRK